MVGNFSLAEAVHGISATGLAVLSVAVGLGVVGATDDLIKIKRQRSLGLNKTTKFLGQALVAVGFSVAVVHFAHVEPELSFVRNTGLRLGAFFYLWGFIMVAASSNAVNLTDGLDGLASGSSALVLA